MQFTQVTDLHEDAVVIEQNGAIQISLQEIDMRESAISSDTVYCCIIHGTF